jgi:CubicO group peptidase (beta-lactamase class C family)
MRKHHNSRSMGVLLLSLLIILSAGKSLPAGSSHGPDGFVFPETAQGHAAKAWFEAFNTQDFSAMKEFQYQYWSGNLLSRSNEVARQAVFQRLVSELGSLQPREITEQAPDALSVLAESPGGSWLEVGFRFDVQNYKITGILLDDAVPPEDLPPEGPLTESQAVEGIENRLDRMAQEDLFSGTVIIAKNGEPLFSRASGMASREFSVPNNLDTKFNLGSINKLFTRVAIAQLLEQGKLSLNDSLGKFLPDYPNPDATRKVTVGNLLNMSSGIGDFFGPKFDATPKHMLRNNSDYLQLFEDQPLAFEPGTRVMYSNAGYVLLGLIIEKASGQDYYQYVREKIFLPTGMTHTDSYHADAVVPNLACGYTHQGPGGSQDQLIKNIYTRPARGSSAGGGYSTAPDLLKFANALESDKLLAPDYTDWILGGPQPGTADQDAPGQRPRRLGIAGGAPGINADLEMGLPGGYTVVVMSNLDPQAAIGTARMIAKWLSQAK